MWNFFELLICFSTLWNEMIQTNDTNKWKNRWKSDKKKLVKKLMTLLHAIWHNHESDELMLAYCIIYKVKYMSYKVCFCFSLRAIVQFHGIKNNF